MWKLEITVNSILTLWYFEDSVIYHHYLQGIEKYIYPMIISPSSIDWMFDKTDEIWYGKAKPKAPAITIEELSKSETDTRKAFLFAYKKKGSDIVEDVIINAKKLHIYSSPIELIIKTKK